jgi:hypothetical protein
MTLSGSESPARLQHLVGTLIRLCWFKRLGSSSFAHARALPEVIPVLFQLLTHQDEDAEEGEWNVSMAAGTCLSFLAQAVHDPIVPAVFLFIEANIKQENWHKHVAAVTTFGSILVGPDPTVLTPLVNQALPILINMMTDPQSRGKTQLLGTSAVFARTSLRRSSQTCTCVLLSMRSWRGCKTACISL